ncbi:hypothetical protein MPDQ_007667 [Monascus purpureus]|uniref:Uncharacterized protein n=1 Tax=Monascus purpureus TaxID=5098 RepID=A0A507QRK7_MONPU|nr:hypothetical protein MPDQ_007667 [Monascus purpureus]
MNLEEFLEVESPHVDGSEPVDLRALDYVAGYDDHLMCPICHCPFVCPVRLQCDHVFCQSCLNTAITTIGASPDDFKCPNCRAPAREIALTVPRLLVNMCNEIEVKCPFSTEGCDETMPRGHVQTHVDKYCGYRPVDCPDPECNRKTLKKDLHPDKKCMHKLHRCPNCGEEVMEQDLEITVVRRELDEHVGACTKAILPCAASKYGCPVKVKRTDLRSHETSCPLTALGPYLEAQTSRIDSLELTVRHLQQRNEVFEDAFASIRSTLFEASPGRSRSSRSFNPSSENNQPTPPPESPTENLSNLHSANADANATTYLLSLHESLREEVAQLSRAITDLDARASMTIMNECLRINEDMAHTNAALNSIRMQIQWLMNPRLHYQAQRTADMPTSDGNESRPSQISSPAPGPSSVGAHSLRPRRLSDTGREGTKL